MGLSNHEVTNHNGIGSDKDTLYMLSGAALILFGAGLILSNPVVRLSRTSGTWAIFYHRPCPILIGI
jgi:hypothetical protein